MAVIFPFAKGSGYREGFDYHIWPYYKAWLLEKQKRNWGAWPTNNAQLLQLENIRYDRYQDLVVLKATEVSNRLQQWGVYAYPGLQRDQVEIDFVAHSGGAHIALNTARYMPSGYKVDDVVSLGGLYKAHEWKETGGLASIGHFYDFVATLDEVRAMRDGLVGDDRFNYTGWHHDEWCDEECLGEVGESDFVGDIGMRRETCCKNFDQMVNKTYVRKGDHHSGYWTHSEVLGALDLILCENKE